MTMTTTTTSFFLLDFLAETMLAKQSRDLSALSEFMSNLVKSQAQSTEGLRKSATDSTHSTQEFVKLFLGTTQTQVNAQAASHSLFLAESFQPKFQTVVKALQEQAQASQKLQRTITAELQQQAELVSVMLTDQKDGMNRLREMAQQWDQVTDAQLRRISEQQTLSGQALSDYDAESNKQVQMLLNLVNSIQQTRENFKSRMNDTNAEVSTSVQKAQEERGKFYHVVEGTANDFVAKGKELRTQLESARATLLQTVTASLEKGVGRVQEASRTCAVIDGDVSGHVTASQAAWQELYGAQEADLRKHSDHLNTALLSHAHLTTDSLQSLHVAAQTQESMLEEQRADMITLVRERKDDAEGQSTALSDWGTLLATEIKQRNEDVVKFLVEDIRHDVPTGQTPQRRDFAFPRYLAATSPHDRILERFNQERGEPVTDEEDDDAAEFSQLSRRDAKAAAAGVAHANGNGSHLPAHRSASMNDLTDPDAPPVSSARPSRPSEIPPATSIPLHRAQSVEGSLIGGGGGGGQVGNKENFIVPTEPPPPSSGGGKKSKLPGSNRKILTNAQNVKSQ